MTINEFLAIHLPTTKPKEGDRARAWAGWIANLYISATDIDITLNEVTAAMETVGYDAKNSMFVVSGTELRRADRRFGEKMLKNRKDGRGV
jgi:hypothetical protein